MTSRGRIDLRNCTWSIWMPEPSLEHPLHQFLHVFLGLLAAARQQRLEVRLADDFAHGAFGHFAHGGFGVLRC